MLNIVLLLVMLSIGMGVVMCLDFRWIRPAVRHDRRRFLIGDMQGSASRNSSSDQLSPIRGHGSEDLGFFVNKGESRCHPLESP